MVKKAMKDAKDNEVADPQNLPVFTHFSDNARMAFEKNPLLRDHIID